MCLLWWCECVYNVCLNFGVVYGVGVCVNVCGVVCVVVCCDVVGVWGIVIFGFSVMHVVQSVFCWVWCEESACCVVWVEVVCLSPCMASCVDVRAMSAA